ncbi:hypothetical protein [Rhodoblastus acidophilus]|uniref:hypothetical protein n=1 Tax=Rhodoblastus acidophilus TaxID=1074 RepID=UPI0022243A52|nr:hypothetical protein [Rhodoblastus acidophilus]
MRLQIQQEPLGSFAPSTNRQPAGATNSLQDRQSLPSPDGAWKRTAAWDSLTLALAAPAGSSEPAAKPPTSKVLRETLALPVRVVMAPSVAEKIKLSRLEMRGNSNTTGLERSWFARGERHAPLARQIQHVPSGSIGPSTKAQLDGATNSAQERQVLSSADNFLNRTASFDSLTWALASPTGSAAAQPAGIPPSKALREKCGFLE